MGKCQTEDRYIDVEEEGDYVCTGWDIGYGLWVRGDS